MNNHAVIRSYLRSDREACLNIFDLNCARYFNLEERSDLEVWLDGQNSGKITYETSMAEVFMLFQTSQRHALFGE
ncbi:MAG: hypothetical protein ACI8SE_002038 [Bacteroidia bacterium]|jgi:hypothetical protein